MDGFLSFSRASFMLDFLVVALILVLPLILASIYFVKKKNYKTHKTFQIIIGIALLVTVILFELEVRIIGWRQFAKASPYYDSLVFPSLYIHLFFSIPTTFLWTYTSILALKKFSNPPSPGKYSQKHKFYAKLSIFGLLATSLTGVIFYWLAFVAT